MTPPTLEQTVDRLRAHRAELERRGVAHAAVFGSVARNEAGAASDIDVLVELDPTYPMGVFEYARLGIDLSEWLGARVDLVNRGKIKPYMSAGILRDAVDAY